MPEHTWVMEANSITHGLIFNTLYMNNAYIYNVLIKLVRRRRVLVCACGAHVTNVFPDRWRLQHLSFKRPTCSLYLILHPCVRIPDGGGDDDDGGGFSGVCDDWETGILQIRERPRVRSERWMRPQGLLERGERESSGRL